MKTQIEMLKTLAKAYTGGNHNLSRTLRGNAIKLGIVSKDGCPKGNYVNHFGKFYGITFVSNELGLNTSMSYRQFYENQEGIVVIDLDSLEIIIIDRKDLVMPDGGSRIKPDGSSSAKSVKFYY